MKEKPLIKTNVYLKNSELYKESLFINVLSSSSIELGTLNPSIIKALKKQTTPTFISCALNKKK